jgi:predicted 3-demethylubiquinone-9 3-methyltransferase (glyoxalase superfamily)
MTKIAKNTICLWYERDAEEAARFYAKTFPDSSIDAVHRAPGDFPSGKQEEVLTVEFRVMGISWQITPIVLTKAYTSADRSAARRAFDAMMTMKKIDIAVIEAAISGQERAA